MVSRQLNRQAAPFIMAFQARVVYDFDAVGYGELTVRGSKSPSVSMVP